MSPQEAEYLTPFLSYGEGAFVEKRSKFTGRLLKAETQDEALSFIEKIRSEHRDATHNCFAYTIREGNYLRYSDDGEPQGTAGLPILDVLRRAGIQNACCVVTRYFGGILLGTGGLVRAYTQGAQLALQSAGIAKMSRFSTLLLCCPYALLGTVEHLLPEYHAVTDDISYGADVTLTLSIPEGGETALNLALAEASSGAVQAEVIETKFKGVQIK